MPTEEKHGHVSHKFHYPRLHACEQAVARFTHFQLMPWLFSPARHLDKRIARNTLTTNPIPPALSLSLLSCDLKRGHTPAAAKLLLDDEGATAMAITINHQEERRKAGRAGSSSICSAQRLSSAVPRSAVK